MRGNRLLRSPRAEDGRARGAGEPPAPGVAPGTADAPGPAARPPARGGADEPPPFLGSWGVLYALVIGGLVLMIVLCAAITRWGP